MDAVKRKWHGEQFSKYLAVQATYKDLAETLGKILVKAANRYAPAARVDKREKAPVSFAEKIIRKYDKYKDPLKSMTDLAGARVVTYTQDEAQAICAWIESEDGLGLWIDRANSVDKLTELGEDKFGYVAVHYVVELRGDAILGEPIAPNVRSVPGERSYRAEIQVATQLQHVWAAIGHDRIYKSAIKAPPELKRRLSGIAALLETADAAFAEGVRQLDAYLLNFDAYLSPQEIADEIDRWEVILERRGVPDKDAFARLGRLLLAAERWSEAYKKLQNLADVPRSDVQRDLGWAAWRAGKGDIGRTHLKEALEIDPGDVVARCRLAHTCLNDDLETALRELGVAFDQHSTDPRVLAPYLECQVRSRKTTGFLPMMHGTLRAAIRHCEERARRGVYLPQAHFDRGRLYLFLGEPYRALDAYALAVCVSHSIAPIEEESAAIERIMHDLTAGKPGKPEDLCADPSVMHYQWIRMFLAVATAAKRLALADAAAAEATSVLGQCETLEKELAECARLASEATDRQKRDGQETLAADKRLLATECGELADAAAKKAGLLKQQLEADRKALAPLASAPFDASNAGDMRLEWKQPIVIVAGGCDPTVHAFVAGYEDHLKKALRGFDGTIVCGGTTSGIAGVVGGLDLKAGGVVKIGYLPDDMPKTDTVARDQYGCLRRSFGKSYTPAGPLQTWADLLSRTDVAPSRIRLLGINGGDLSGVEFRIAAAMGAVVGIVQESERAADSLIKDEFWSNTRRVAPLPNDWATWRAFLLAYSPEMDRLDKGKVEAAAKFVHAEFCRQNLHSQKKHHESVLPWDAERPNKKLLPGILKASNRHQVRYARLILAAVGYDIVDESDPRPAPEATELKAKIPEMAELEHGRYCAERLADGWRHGTTNDPEKQTNPTLVPWSALSDDDKDYDREAVGNFPKWLAGANLKIVNADKQGNPT
jgi:ppGpp synthetase/RelA/SpoT-type nucleotidyltranferase